MKKAFAIAWLSPILLAADTHYVRPPETCTNTAEQFPYTSWENAATNIQWAVNAAGTEGTVLVSNGVYRLTNNVVITDAIYVRSWMDGALDPTNTVLDGQSNVACLYLNHTGAVVAGLAFTNGNGVGGANDNYGGAVYIGGTDAAGGTLSNCIVSGNTVLQQGGGIYARGDNVLIVDCRIEGNIVQNANDRGGGGVCLYNSTIRRCTVRENVILAASSLYTGGGGIASCNAALIEACLITGNTTTNNGGGIFCTEAAVIRDSIIQSNRATGANAVHGGGGIMARNPSTQISGCLIADNSATNNGGGLFIQAAASGNWLVISNSTLCGNGAGANGGGVNLSPGSQNYAVTSIIASCVLETNTALTGGGIYVGSGGVLVDCCVIRGNQANNEGGIRTMNPSVNYPYILRNTLIVGNSALTNSGGGRVRYGAMVQNCTVANNAAGVAVGGLWLDGTNAVYGASSASNLICRYNYVGAAENNINVRDGGIVAWTCTAPTNGLTGPGNIEADPLFVDTNAGNYRLQAGSPCINAGALQPAWMPDGLDLDGRPRLDRFSRVVDMGCHEHIAAGMLMQIR